MNLSDEEMVRRLITRDGPLPLLYSAHNVSGECRYAEVYEGQTCPWCAAADRRNSSEAAARATS